MHVIFQIFPKFFEVSVVFAPLCDKDLERVDMPESLASDSESLPTDLLLLSLLFPDFGLFNSSFGSFLSLSRNSENRGGCDDARFLLFLQPLNARYQLF